jgi:hypothetical protein
MVECLAIALAVILVLNLCFLYRGIGYGGWWW